MWRSIFKSCMSKDNVAKPIKSVDLSTSSTDGLDVGTTIVSPPIHTDDDNTKAGPIVPTIVFSIVNIDYSEPPTVQAPVAPATPVVPVLREGSAQIEQINIQTPDHTLAVVPGEADLSAVPVENALPSATVEETLSSVISVVTENVVEATTDTIVLGSGPDVSQAESEAVFE